MDDMKNRIRQNRFVRNNGAVLRAANVLRYKFIAYKDLRYAIGDDITEPELLDSINFLALSDYVELRHVRSHAAATLADIPPEEIELKLSDGGIRLLAGKKSDDCVEV